MIMMNQVMMMTREKESLKDHYKGFAFLQNDILSSMQDKLAKPRSWMFLDSCRCVL